MDCGIVGLGRMGAGVAGRILLGGHRVVAWNRSPEKVDDLVGRGAEGAEDLTDLVSKLPAPRVVWAYLPAGDVSKAHLQELLDLLQPGDTLIDGGNSRFSDSISFAERCATKGVHFLDVGTSGGVQGAQDGYCVMVGGNADVYKALQPLWDAVAIEGGAAHVGPSGAGHYVKMVHNAIEYGMMQAYAEGIDLMDKGTFANTLDFAVITELWQHGSIIRSFLGEQVAKAATHPEVVNEASSTVAHSGEGLWAVQEALAHNLAVPVMNASLFARFQSIGKPLLGNRYLSVVRNLFGGHAL